MMKRLFFLSLSFLCLPLLSAAAGSAAGHAAAAAGVGDAMPEMSHESFIRKLQQYKQANPEYTIQGKTRKQIAEAIQVSVQLIKFSIQDLINCNVIPKIKKIELTRETADEYEQEYIGKTIHILDLSNLHIRSLYGLEHIFYINSVQKLILNNNPLQILDSAQSSDYETYSITNLVNLEILHLSNCTSLKELPSLSKLKKLKIINLNACYSLESLTFQKDVYSGFQNCFNNPNLNSLILSHCTRLTKLPYFSRFYNNALQVLNLNGCTALRTFPDSIRDLTQSLTIHLINCPALRTLPANLPQTITIISTEQSSAVAASASPATPTNYHAAGVERQPDKQQPSAQQQIPAPVLPQPEINNSRSFLSKILWYFNSNALFGLLKILFTRQ